IKYPNLSVKTPYKDRLGDLGMDSLWERYNLRKIVNVYKHRLQLNTTLCDSDIEFTMHARRGPLIKLPFRRINFIDRAPTIHACILFNDLPLEIRMAKNISSFKS